MAAIPSGKSADAMEARPPGAGGPVACLRYDHDQLCEVCARLDRLVDDPFHEGSRRDALSVLEYLSTDLPLHVADEEDLFELLAARCAAADEMDAIVALLDQEHRRDEQLVEDVIAGLEALIAGEQPETPLAFLINAMSYAENQRRHLAWENITILPLAEKRLNEADRAELTRRMAARRK